MSKELVTISVQEENGTVALSLDQHYLTLDKTVSNGISFSGDLVGNDVAKEYLLKVYKARLDSLPNEAFRVVYNTGAGYYWQGNIKVRAYYPILAEFFCQYVAKRFPECFQLVAVEPPAVVEVPVKKTRAPRKPKEPAMAA
jgi:hypothetical protein